MLKLKHLRCLLLCAPQVVWAHGFGERYDLPVPMNWVIFAACCVVLLSFLWTPFIQNKDLDVTRFTLNLQAQNPAFNPPGPLTAWTLILKVCAVALLLLTFLSAFFGSADPLMNFSPTFIWIVWWLGSSFACMLFGNHWQHLDPWLCVYQSARVAWLRVGNASRQKPLLNWPLTWGRWPACLSLLTWCGLEIIYPIAAMPHRLGWFIAAYSAITWLGMTLWGPSQWRSHADGFTLYFELIGQARHMLMGHGKEDQATMSCPSQADISTVALLIAIFTSVLFDGIHAGPAWLVFEKWMTHLAFMRSDTNGYWLGALGLIGLWLSLLLSYLLTCYATRCLLNFCERHASTANDVQVTTVELANAFLASLLPIAMAYLLAHNFSSFFIQGQNIIALSSDPFGFGWNLLGTAQYYPDISLVDAKLTWYVATFSIVLGHVISVFMSHRVANFYAMRTRGVRLKAWVLNLPVTLVMIALTAISLTIIAEPLVN